MENIVITNEWDKTFPKSEKVNQRKVTFYILKTHQFLIILMTLQTMIGLFLYTQHL